MALVVCRSGCIVPKSAPRAAEMISALTVTPQVENKEVEPIKVFATTRNNYLVPKFFAQRFFKDSLFEHKYGADVLIDMEFKGALREYQEEVIAKALPMVRRGEGGLLSLPCGAGKTTVALYIAAQLGVKTLIVVHQTFLMNQWIERIQQFLPNVRIGRVMGKYREMEGCDIVIGMLQSLSMKDYPPRFFDHSLTIIDECHHISSRVFSKALFKINSKYMLGLSATPRRADKMEHIFHWFVGATVFDGYRKKVDFAEVRQYFFTSKDPLFRSIFVKGTKNYNTSRMITNFTEVEERNELIVKVIRELEESRKVLVLSDRVEHLKKIEKGLCALQCGYYIGGMKEKQLKEAEAKRVILATYHYACEGLDIKGLDTVILATPRTRIEQSVGRILRKERLSDYQHRPVIIDVVDNIAPFNNYFFVRNRFYTAEKFQMKKIHQRDE